MDMLWKTAPAQAVAADNDPGFAALAARRVILAEMQRAARQAERPGDARPAPRAGAGAEHCYAVFFDDCAGDFTAGESSGASIRSR